MHDELNSDRLSRRSRALEVLFHQSSIGICCCDIKTKRFLDVNPHFCEMVGYSAEEICEMTFFDLTHPDDRTATQQQVNDLVDGNISKICFEKRYLKKNGETLWVKAMADLIYDECGFPVYTVATLQDITARKLEELKLTAREKLFREMADSIPQLAAIAQSDGQSYLVQQAMGEPLRKISG